eukprot:TRINITY_DN5285_c0_g1_i15.p1 TRINITY_DN5285_c0_g1~~TRINITY_DN5285_c0_g1_i15.p1  ORF type:complete len:104 (+),score=12.27 TRINITY_DN5285_c0_g1_i15:95-406(+)
MLRAFCTPSHSGRASFVVQATADEPMHDEQSAPPAAEQEPQVELSCDLRSLPAEAWDKCYEPTSCRVICDRCLQKLGTNVTSFLYSKPQWTSQCMTSSLHHLL